MTKGLSLWAKPFNCCSGNGEFDIHQSEFATLKQMQFAKGFIKLSVIFFGPYLTLTLHSRWPTQRPLLIMHYKWQHTR
jgi:hypothetical protein